MLEGTKMLQTSSPRLSKTPTTTPRRWKGGEHQVDHEEYNQKGPFSRWRPPSLLLLLPDWGIFCAFVLYS